MAFACLDELRHGVEARFDREALLEAKEVGETGGLTMMPRRKRFKPSTPHFHQNGALKTSLKPLLKELQARFDDPTQADRVLQAQVKKGFDRSPPCLSISHDSFL